MAGQVDPIDGHGIALGQSIAFAHLLGHLAERADAVHAKTSRYALAVEARHLSDAELAARRDEAMAHQVPAYLGWLSPRGWRRSRDFTWTAGFLYFYERPHLHYAAAAHSLRDAVDRVERYAYLIHEIQALEVEHRRRYPGHAVIAAAAFALSLRPDASDVLQAQRDPALHVLESYLPLLDVADGKFGGGPQDRAIDRRAPLVPPAGQLVNVGVGFFQHALRVNMAVLAQQRVSLEPVELMRQLYRADKALAYLPRAAKRDFQDERRAARTVAGKPLDQLAELEAGWEEEGHVPRWDAEDGYTQLDGEVGQPMLRHILAIARTALQKIGLEPQDVQQLLLIIEGRLLGHTDAAIAAHLGRSESTVRRDRRRLRKLPGLRDALRP